MKNPVTGRSRQRGAVAVLTGLTIAVLIGFLGISVDLGRLFVIKSELQTAMDACALAASTQLRGDATSIADAIKFGQTMSDVSRISASGAPRPISSANAANFQDAVVQPNSIQFEFSATLAGPYESAASATPTSAKFVRCTYPMSNVPVYFARVLPGGPASAAVAATAVATLASAQTACAVPIAVCRGAASSPWGLQKAIWGTGKTAPGDNYGTGDFGWVDFPASPAPPECGSAGGANYVKCLMTVGQCNLRSGDPVKEQDASGNMSSLTEAWNARFGLYRNNPIESIPDRTGWAYTEQSWGDPNGAVANSAFDGVPLAAPGGMQLNYLDAAAQHQPYQGDTQSGVSTSSPKYYPLSSTDHTDRGRDRRIATAPIVDCSVWGSGSGSANPVIDDWACVLLLSPTEGGNKFKAKVEILGLASAAGSPCATSGLPGGTIGPKVPGLVQ